ncbi:spondin domain-containing protein [Ferrimonas kyonanensis]|uniref:spondin domain-containing protein n=1 Tax=Ferrimonas kyonanensis TaxID=364763 RepID=UPI0004111242|nr:spondin domain-containing protein [Ferrimonas kyonanensis]
MNRSLPILTLTAASLLAGCSDNDSNAIIPEPQEPEMATFEVTVINLTAAQPMSPVAAYLHNGTASGWRFGQAASVELEQLAEAGDGSGWLSRATDNGAFATASGDGILMPGASQTLSLTLETGNTLMLTSATMLVNTNDAFAGINGWDLTDLAVGDSMTVTLPVYDAGTEANSELAATIPGPAGGGAGFDSSRDDVDFVARHPGVVGNQDGAADSALDGRHSFDAPVARLTVMRSQ